MADTVLDQQGEKPSKVTTLDQSSPESGADDQDEATAQPTSPNSASQQPRVPGPLQKRRRVDRACDGCRRKKIKCDGKAPCTHCTVYSYDCTYDQPSNRRRNPAPHYIEALENRLQRAENLLKTFLPNIDLNDPNISAAIQQRWQAANGKENGTPSSEDKAGSEATEQDAQLRSMIESTGELDLDEEGCWDFHGGSSGRVFVHRMRDQFGDLLGGNGGLVLPRLPPPPSMAHHHIFESPKSSHDSPFDSGLSHTMDLPSREDARALCADSLNYACALLRFVHQPIFYEMFDRIYDTPAENYGNAENRFLPLLYVVLALGCLFHIDPVEPENSLDVTYKESIDQGLKYYRAAQQMIDITDCRDLTSLQTIVFMTMFLQCSANLSTCYSYIGIALRASLRMGLHRNLGGNFNPIERESRKRVFWVIRKMDTYISTLLGFPHMLSTDDIDQELPIEVDDDYITKDAVLPMPEGRISMYTASNAHARLMIILAKVVKYIYPIKGLEQSIQGNQKASYIINYAKIREIEKDLAEWLDKLPMALRPGGDGGPEIMRVPQLLRLAYAHVQMMLYRPFLHYVSDKACAGKSVDDRCYACAAACVSVSRNIVHITVEMKKRGLLVGTYWFTMYTTFFAILSLVFFVLENPDKNGSKQILADANDGKDALKGLARRSLAADGCSVALLPLFDRLPETLRKSRPNSSSSKKRRSIQANAPPSEPTHIRRSSHPTQSETEPTAGLPKASTFPIHPPNQTSSTAGTPLQVNTLPNLNLKSFQDLVSPTLMSGSGTPDSTSTPQSLPQPPYDTQQPFGANSVLPDLSAMMFPSADPFAYPSQPASKFDSSRQENDPENIPDSSSAPQTYLPNNGSVPGIYDDLEGQLFGPIPPWMQGQQNYEMTSQMGTEPTMMSGLNAQDLNYPIGFMPNTDMTFDGIFSGEGDEWNMLADQRYNR